MKGALDAEKNTSDEGSLGDDEWEDDEEGRGVATLKSKGDGGGGLT